MKTPRLLCALLLLLLFAYLATCLPGATSQAARPQAASSQTSPERWDPTLQSHDQPGTGTLVDISGRPIPLRDASQGPPKDPSPQTPKNPPPPKTLPPIPPGVPLYFSQGVANYYLNTIPDGPLDWRYQYLSGGVNTNDNWYTWGEGNGSFATVFLDDSIAAGYRPVFIYYQIEQSLPRTDNNSVRHLTDSQFMVEWFLDFKRLMQLCAGRGTIIINIEPDMLGYWEQATIDFGNDPAEIAALVAASGFPEAQGYPNNGLGVMQVFAHLRDLYAPNVILGLDISQWGPRDDVVASLRQNPNFDWQGHAIKVGTFLSRAGQVPSGAGYQLLFYSPLDRDAAYYELIRNIDLWWDEENTTQPTFDTMGAWVGQVIQTVGKRALMWQVPIGNELYRPENNAHNHYQDNRPQYFLNSSSGREHMSEWADRGIVGMMWGAGASDQSNYYDASTDGITNPKPINGNTMVAIVDDDDGGYLRLSLPPYYQNTIALPGGPPTATPTVTATGTATPTGTWSTNTPTLTPTQTLTPVPVTPTPVPPTPTQGPPGIYDDSMLNGWEESSWSSTVALTDTQYIHSGTHSISVSIYAAWGAFRVFNRDYFNTGNYTSLDFWVHGGTEGGQQLQIFVSFPPPVGGIGDVLHLEDYVPGGSILPGHWQFISIPLQDLRADNTAIDTIVIQDRLGPNQGTFFLDDITFGSGPVPTRTITPITTSTLTSTSIPTSTSTATITFTATATPPATTSTATPLACHQYPDVPPNSTFYAYIQCLSCRGIITGYPDGTYRPANPVTRAQLAKIVSGAAGFSEPHTEQTFEDIPVDSTFYIYIERLASRQVMSGYPCGQTPQEPCTSGKPYFRPQNNATRGQTAKIISQAAGYNEPPVGTNFEDVAQGSAFYSYIQRLYARSVMSGYPCGQGVPSEPCVPPQNRPYFRPGNNVTRGQAAKLVSNTFYPTCQLSKK